MYYRKIDEKGKLDEDIESMWKHIHELTSKINNIEKAIENTNANFSKYEELKIDVKYGMRLNDELNKLHEVKNKLKENYKNQYDQ